MQRMILSLLISFFMVMAMGPKVIPALRRLHFGQTIYDLGPKSHLSKQGTPIMGGLMVAAAVVVCALALHPGAWQGKWDFTLALLAVSLLSMLVGFADDYIKAVLKRHDGLSPWQKIAGQVLVAVGFSCYCYFHPQVGSSVMVPFLNVEWDLGWCYIPLMSLVVIFMVNSANLQDGLDGLLSSVTCVGSVGWSMMALFMALAVSGDDSLCRGYLSIAVFGMALVGGTMGFLRFNHYPAKVFMGDTGSMFVGGAVVGMSMLMRQPLMMLLITFTMVMSSVSVIIQRVYFKITKKLYGQGRRVFKMSPIHHHFEMCGMSETQIVAMYAVITGILSLVAVLSMAGLQV